MTDDQINAELDRLADLGVPTEMEALAWAAQERDDLDAGELAAKRALAAEWRAES